MTSAPIEEERRCETCRHFHFGPIEEYSPCFYCHGWKPEIHTRWEPKDYINKLIDHLRKMRDLYSDKSKEGLSDIMAFYYYTGAAQTYNDLIDYLTKPTTQGSSDE